jgi:catechol 2,3-dioxygenase-like lactoylglutathione lyase family enzyme
VGSSTGIKRIDHAAILVADLAKAAGMYRRLGFKTTPIGRHDNVGTANHLLMFDEDFFEMLGIETPTDFYRQWADAIAEREGLWGLAFSSDNVPATYAHLKAAGFSPTEPREFSRPVNLGGEVRQARFTLTYLEPDAVPGIRAFVCQHHTPDLVWRPEYLGQPNRTTSLAHLTLAVDDPVAAAGAYARLTGTVPMPRPGGMDVPGPGATIRLMSPAQAAIEFAGDAVLEYRRPAPIGAGFAVADQKAVRSHLRAAGVAFREGDSGAARVASDKACGVALDFL